MSSHPTDGIAELVSQLTEDLFNLLVRDADALKWTPTQRKEFRRWLGNEASAWCDRPGRPYTPTWETADELEEAS